MSDGANIHINFEGDAFIAIKNLQAEFTKLTQRVTIFEGDVKESFNTLTSSVTKFKTSIKQISFAAIADNVRNVADAFRTTTQPGVEFNQQIADLSAITGIAGGDLDVLSNAARKVGKESGLGASQAAEAFKLLASNIDVSVLGGVQGLKQLQKETITLSQAAGVDLPTAANAMAFSINQFNLPASDAARVINVLGAGAKYGAAEIPDLSASLKEAGSVAAQAGVSIESAVGAIEILSQRGIKGGEAGTTLRNILIKLQTEAIPGVNLKAEGLSKSLAKMTGFVDDATRMEKIFGRENITAAQILIAEAAAVENMTTRVTGTQVAYEQAAIRTKTYAHELELVKARMDDFKIGILNVTGSLLPWSEYLIQSLVPLSQMIPLISAIGSGIKVLTTAQWALNAAQYAMPILAIVAGLALLGGAIYSLTRKYDAASLAADQFEKASKKAKDATFEERFETERLLKVARDTRLSTEQRTKALDALKEKSKEYFGQLTLETVATEAGTKAFNAYAESIQRVALAEVLKERLKDNVRKQEEISQEGPDRGFFIWLDQMRNMAVGSLMGGKGIAKAAAINAKWNVDLADYQIGEIQKVNEQIENRVYNIETGFQVPQKPLVMAPGYDQVQNVSNVNTRQVRTGDINTTINIHTNSMKESHPQLKRDMEYIFKSALTDAQQAP